MLQWYASNGAAWSEQQSGVISAAGADNWHNLTTMSVLVILSLFHTVIQYVIATLLWNPFADFSSLPTLQKTWRRLFSAFSQPWKTANLTFSQHHNNLDVCKIPAYDPDPNQSELNEFSYQIRRWRGWRRQHRWAMNCRWTSWWSPMWLRWSWKLCRWTCKLENVIVCFEISRKGKMFPMGLIFFNRAHCFICKYYILHIFFSSNGGKYLV